MWHVQMGAAAPGPGWVGLALARSAVLSLYWSLGAVAVAAELRTRVEDAIREEAMSLGVRVIVIARDGPAA